MFERLKRGAVVCAVLALAGCSSLSLDTAAKLRNLDYLNDDVASLLLAFDVPLSIEPIPGESTISFDISTPASGERHIRAVLTEADAGDLAGTLPPPADQRTYYLFGFSEADRAAIRAAQVWARTLPPGNNSLTLSIGPRFCRTIAIDPARVAVSVLVALPGAGGLAPLLSHQSLKDMLAASPSHDLPVCAGHSG